MRAWINAITQQEVSETNSNWLLVHTLRHLGGESLPNEEKAIK